MDGSILSELADVVGAPHLLSDPELRGRYEQDISGRFRGSAAAVLRPADTRQIAAALRICATHGLPVIPQGGNTGLVGGGVPRQGGVVLSLERLKRLDPVETLTARVVAGAGVTLGELQGHAAAAGLEVGIDFAARAGATLGGMAATDAGGQLALRHGTMRAQIAGLQAVLADGTVIDRLAGPPKDNAGYDLSQLIVGSEGTLAVITALNVRLVSKPRHRVSALFGLGGLEQALDLLGQLRRGLSSLESADFFEAPGLELVRAHSGLAAPLAGEHEAYLIVGLAGESDPLTALGELIEGAGLEYEIAVGESSSERAALWAYRELHNEALARVGPPQKLDVSVPVPALARFAAELRRAVARLAPAARVILYGHLGDGNVHVNVLGAESGGSGPDAEALDRTVLELAACHGGSISAEHGLGIAKAAYLGLVRSPGEIEAMWRIKLALDPKGLLNPGVGLPSGKASESAGG